MTFCSLKSALVMGLPISISGVPGANLSESPNRNSAVEVLMLTEYFKTKCQKYCSKVPFNVYYKL